MHDFDKVVYLDMQKTGSNFVSQFLRAACLCPEKHLQKHAWIESDYRPDSVYFTTVREPLMLYSSLYRFGLDQRGGIYVRLKKDGLLSVYSSFDSFIAFILDPANASLLHPHYDGQVASELGFMSFRHLLLNLQNPLVKIRSRIEEGRPVSSLMEETIIRFVLRNESLNDDLLRLSTEWVPQYFDADRAREFLENAPRANQSSTTSGSVALTSQLLADAIAERESLLMAHYR